MVSTGFWLLEGSHIQTGLWFWSLPGAPTRGGAAVSNHLAIFGMFGGDCPTMGTFFLPKGWFKWWCFLKSKMQKSESEIEYIYIYIYIYIWWPPQNLVKSVQMASFNVQLAFPFPTPPLDLAPVQLCNGCCSGTKIFLDKGIQNSRTLTARKLALKEHLEPFQTYKIAFILVTHCKGS